ncbi:YceD family protein [Pararhodonellum marinum]|uniref:YceD family protein n=1 Tax=Pararhodonellum marinum TaxID=2755358 RepID=UPI00188FCD6E|nr:DUF177 domain-containing protein [Pararhodonellum marinum]
MKLWRAYEIEVIKLNEGQHEFTFEISDPFFALIKENNLIQKGSLTALVAVNKLPNLIETQFNITGTVRLTCDRSLEEFDHPLETSQKVLYKFGAEEKEINEDIFMITRNTPNINVAQLIYEFIILALPAKKIHPDYLEEMDEDEFEGEGEMVYVSEIEDESEPLDKADEENPDKTDPRWEILKKLKNKS